MTVQKVHWLLPFMMCLSIPPLTISSSHNSRKSLILNLEKIASLYKACNNKVKINACNVCIVIVKCQYMFVYRLYSSCQLQSSAQS